MQNGPEAERTHDVVYTEIEELQQLGADACLGELRSKAEGLLREWLELPDVNEDDVLPADPAAYWLWDLLEPLELVETDQGCEQEPRAEVGLIDEAMAERHLALLGIGPSDPVILCAYGDTNRYSPARQGEKYEWPGQATRRDWPTLRHWLTKAVTKNLGFISCPGGTRVHDRRGPAEIFECSLLMYEIDGLPKDKQWGIWEKAGLPEPTCVLDTGNKSLHCWYRLSEPVSPAEGKDARKRLSLAIEEVLPEGIKTDRSMHNPHQPARLAGGIHPKTGRRSELVLESGNIYKLDELMALCPELPPEVATDRTGTIWRDDDGGDPESIDLPDLPLPKPVPLTIALGDKSLRDIEQGVAEGGRRLRAWSLSQTLQCAEEQLRELGQPFTGSAEELWEQFVERCGLDPQAIGDAGYWVEDDNIGEGDLSRSGLAGRLRRFAIEECGWDPNDWWNNPKEGGLLWRAKEYTRANLEKMKALCKEGNRRIRERTKPLEARQLTYTQVRQKAFEAALDGDEDQYNEALGEIATRFRKDERKMLPELLRCLREKFGKRTYTTGEIDIRSVENLSYTLEGFLPSGEVVHLFAPWFKGKTSLAIGMCCSLIKGEGFLDVEIAAKPTKCLFIQTDAGASRFRAELEKQDVLEDPRFVPGPEQMLHVWAPDDLQGVEAWSATFRGLMKLRAEAQALEVGAIFIDSVKGMMSGTGMDYTHNETVNQFVTLLRQTIAQPLQLPVVLLNHKGTDHKEGAGAKAWSEACGQVIEIQGVEKDKQEMTRVRELIIRKDSIGGPRRFHYTLEDGKLRPVMATEVIKDGADALLSILRTWALKGRTQFTRKELVAVDGGVMDVMSRATLDRTLDRLCATGGPLKKLGRGRFELREG